jgi:hypothetical protein
MSKPRRLSGSRGGVIMVWIRCCPRCKGDVQDNRDTYGNYFVCVQCGYYLTNFEEICLRHLTSFRSLAGSIIVDGGVESSMTGVPEEVQK